jgi:hypothetical protein
MGSAQQTVTAPAGSIVSSQLATAFPSASLDMNGTELILDADGDTSITSDTDDQVDIKVAGSDKVHVTSTGLGVGTTPSQKLHVSASNPFLELQGTASTSGDTGIFLNANANHWILKADNYSETNAFQIKQGDTSSSTAFMTINSIGAVTKPLQPAFLATRQNQISNIAPDTTTTIVFDTEIFDQGSDYNTSTGKFVAPVTGKYQLNFKGYLQQVPSDPEYIYFQLVTSNRNYIHIFDPRGFDTTVQYHHAEHSMLVDMDANDEAYITFYQRLGSQTTDLANGTSSNPNNNFSGYLVA